MTIAPTKGRQIMTTESIKALTPVSINAEHVTSEFVVKIHGRCNLDCTYCYMYESADQSWRTKPRKMTRHVMDKVAERIAEYLREHRLAGTRIIIHGGEPLLSGIDDIAYFVNACRRAAPADRTLAFTMQTNGTLFTTKVLDTLLELGITVGVSLDGDEATNVNRPFKSGQNSYQKVSEGLTLIRQDKYRSLLTGILGVLHPDSDPIEIYEHLAQYSVPLDFLWPLANWENPPQGNKAGDQAPYGKWMAAVFDHVYLHERRPDVPVRLLDQLVELVRAAVTHTPLLVGGIELVGPWVNGAIVIEVDGSYELLDANKTVAEGAAFTGLSVEQDPLTRALVAVLVSAQERGINKLPTPCEPCALQEICGGGYYPNRYDGESFNNRSVYCEDLTYLIRHIYNWLKNEVGKRRAS